MKRYSVFAIAREALRQHRGWPRAWASPEPRKRYKVIIVGAGGHGLATAYYLGRNFGITDVAVLDKGWLGGGNTGRNTTIIRSNYLQDPSAAIYEKARSLYETLSQELNYNIMFSPRGVMMLAQTEHEKRGYLRTERANALQGVETRFITREEVKKRVPIINLEGPRYPVLGALWQPRAGTARHDAVAWGYARACSAWACISSRTARSPGSRARAVGDRGEHHARGYRLRETGHRGRRAFGATGRDGRVPPAHRIGRAAGAGERAHQAVHGCRGDGQHRAWLHEPVRQGRDGHRRRRGRVQQLHPARIVAPYRGDRARPRGDLPHHLAAQDAAPLGRHRGHDGRSLAHHLAHAAGGCFINGGWGTGGFKATPGSGWAMAELMARGESPLAAEFGMERFREGRFIDESVAAGVAH
jgi:sarcosine oxidase, subunit beta